MWPVLRAHQPSPGSRRCGETRPLSSTRPSLASNEFCSTRIRGWTTARAGSPAPTGPSRTCSVRSPGTRGAGGCTTGWSTNHGSPRGRGSTGRPLVPYQWLEDARVALSDRYDVRFDSVGINLYRDGADSVAWHRDRIPAEIVDPVVALVSLGEPRTFLLRPLGGGKSRSFRLGQGDLLVTGGQTQRRFEHSVPKVKAVGPPDERRLQARCGVIGASAPKMQRPALRLDRPGAPVPGRERRP